MTNPSQRVIWQLTRSELDKREGEDGRKIQRQEDSSDPARFEFDLDAPQRTEIEPEKEEKKEGFLMLAAELTFSAALPASELSQRLQILFFFGSVS